MFLANLTAQILHGAFTCMLGDCAVHEIPAGELRFGELVHFARRPEFETGWTSPSDSRQSFLHMCDGVAEVDAALDPPTSANLCAQMLKFEKQGLILASAALYVATYASRSQTLLCGRKSWAKIH